MAGFGGTPVCAGTADDGAEKINNIAAPPTISISLPMRFLLD
jgi:hypothetical protein